MRFFIPLKLCILSLLKNKHEVQKFVHFLQSNCVHEQLFEGAFVEGQNLIFYNLLYIKIKLIMNQP